MVYRHLKRGIPVPPHISQLIAIDALIERGYSLEDLDQIGLRLPDLPELPLLMVGVAAGRAQYLEWKMKEAAHK